MKFPIFLLPLCVLLLPSAYSTNNDVTTSQEPIKIDPTLRKALLKALNDLENEETSKSSEGNSIEKAPASTFSFFSSNNKTVKQNDSASTKSDSASTKSDSASTKKPYIIVQRSQSVQKQLTIPASLQKNGELDPIKDAEQILTSASSSFTSDNKINVEARSLQSTSKNTQNYITSNNNVISTTTKTEATTAKITTTTEENQAKVEQLQFFPAPLVVAFTVHQDEQGQPKKVEPIFKSSKQPTSTTEAAVSKTTYSLLQQNDLQSKQKALEDEIYRLRLQQQQQHELLLRQQQELYLRQREEIRLRQNAQPFLPIVNPFQPVFNEPTKTVLNQFTTTQAPATVASTTARNSVVSLQQSISIDPLVEAGKLPLNGQILPNKEAGNFKNQLVQIPLHLQQFNALPFFNQQPQSNRFFRQESGTGNFVNDDFNGKNNNGFNSIANQVQTTNFNNNNNLNSFNVEFKVRNNTDFNNNNGFNSNLLPVTDFNKINGVNDNAFNKNINGFNTNVLPGTNLNNNKFNEFNTKNNGVNDNAFNKNINGFNTNVLPGTNFNNNKFNEFNTKNNGLNDNGFNKNLNNGFNNNFNTFTTDFNIKNNEINSNSFNKNNNAFRNVHIPQTSFNTNNNFNSFSSNNGVSENNFNKNVNNGIHLTNNAFRDNSFNGNALRPNPNGLFISNGFDNQRGTIHAIFDGILTNDFNIQNFQNDFNKNIAPTNGNNGFNTFNKPFGNTNSFALQQSIQPVQPLHENTFVRNQFNNGFNTNNGALTSPILTNNVVDNTIQKQNSRPLRSNLLESTLTNNNVNYSPLQRPLVNNQLNSLLYRSGAFGGQRGNEDLNIVTKVLSLNHLGGDVRGAGGNFGFGGFGKK